MLGFKMKELNIPSLRLFQTQIILFVLHYGFKVILPFWLLFLPLILLGIGIGIFIVFTIIAVILD